MRYQSDYSAPVVAALLDCIWDDGFGVLASRAGQEAGGGGGDPRRCSDILALTADIKRAWSGLSGWDRQMLEAKHKYELGLDVIAFLANLPSAHEAAQHIDAAMERMLQSLNRFTYIERVDAG